MDNPEQTGLPALFRAAAAVAPVAMLIADENGRLLAANRLWIDFAGPPDLTARPDSWMAVLEPESRRHMELHLADVAGGRPTVSSLDLEMGTRAGRRWTRWWARRENFEGRAVITLVVVDVHDEVAQTQDLRQLATHDHLTGLLNRRFFMETVGHSLRRAGRNGQHLALLYVDLDRFKTVNDMAGHSVGDQVLAVVGARLQTAIRGADVAARLGGDEFAILLDDVQTVERATMVADRVESSLSAPIEIGGVQWPVNASVGIAMSVDFSESAEVWLQRADKAMYEAKRSRRRARIHVLTGGGTPDEAPGSDWGAPSPAPATDSLEILERAAPTLTVAHSERTVPAERVGPADRIAPVEAGERQISYERVGPAERLTPELAGQSPAARAAAQAAVAEPVPTGATPPAAEPTAAAPVATATATAEEPPTPAGPAIRPDFAQQEETLAYLRSLREDLARVRRSLDALTEQL